MTPAYAARKHSGLRVWGAGFMFGNSRLNAQELGLDVVSVRGELSKERILGQVSDPGVGDLGLLASLFYEWPEPDPAKRYVLFVPHYMDEGSAFEDDIIDRWNDVKVARTSGSPYELMRKIAGAQMVVSSGLHPLIVADSFGVPNIWLKLSDRVGGGAFKFDDYLSVFNLESRPMDPRIFFRQIDNEIGEYRRPGIGVVRQEVLSSLSLAVSKASTD